jgi:hypothetical protein
VEGIRMVSSSGGIHNVKDNSGRCRKHPDSREKHGKKKYVPTTWEIRNPIVNQYFEYQTSNIGGPLLQEFISGKQSKTYCF